MEPAGPPRYEIRGFLGEGSSARVYRAWDVELRRDVALKVLRDTAEFPEALRERFRREARAAAQVVHPNVVAVFDAGEHAGRLFLVLELVEGRSLQAVLDGAPPGRAAAVELVEKVARGVAAAHARGIVHRDLKPGNILISAAGEPKIGDFGLAFLPDATRGLTQAGAILGTPLYMSPEQVEGREVSARADVYALGAILYQLLVGRPPHAADRLPELYRKILREDPVPPRALVPDLPAELETIVLKALRHDPAGRYPDAAAFAEDLRRAREGRPIEARPASAAARAWSVARRRPALLAAAGAVAALAAGLAFVGAQEGRLRRERAEALESLREAARLAVDAALRLRRAGDPGGMKRFLPPLEEAYARASRRAPGTAEADYLLGRMHRALMDDAKALEHQGRALAKDPDYAPAIYERVVLQARRHDSLFRAAAESMRGQAMPQLTSTGRRAPTRVEVERARPEIRALREAIIADCGRLRRLPRVEEARALAAEGILAYGEQRYADARTRLEEALAREPQLEEAWEALGRVLEGQELSGGTAEEKEALRREAERVYGDAIFLDQAYLPFYLGRGNLFMRDAVAKFRAGLDPRAEQAAAEKDFAECVKIDPGHAEAWQRLGAVRMDRGKHLVNRGLDPRPDWTQAERDFDRSLALRKDSLVTWAKRGFLLTLRGAHELSLGQDPRPAWERAERDLYEALRLQTANTDPWLRLGILRTFRGALEKDPRPAWEIAERNLTEALRIAPGYSEALTRRAALRRLRGNLDGAEADLTESLESEDSAAEARALRGVVRTLRGPEHWDAAEEDFRRVVARAPEFAAGRQGWGELAWARAAHAERRGEPAAAHYALCARELGEALKLNPRLEAALGPRAREALSRASKPGP